MGNRERRFEFNNHYRLKICIENYFFYFRVTPHEWQNPHPCTTEPEELENSLSLINCLWFSLGSILCQGSEVLPR